MSRELGRRARIYQFSRDTIVEMTTKGVSWKINEGIPVDASILGCHFDFESRSIRIHVEHQSFDLVKYGDEFPVGPPLSFERLDNGKI